MHSVGPSIPGVVLLGLVVAAAALLIAGFGPPVGIGVVVGVVLGLVAVGAAVAVSRRSAPFGWSSSGPMPANQADHAATLKHYSQAVVRVAAVDSSTMTGLLAVREEASTPTADIELLTLELYTDGGLATLVARTRPPMGPLGHVANVTVGDDVGTEYVAAGQSTNSPTPSTSRFEVRFAPAPPEAASSLTLTIEGFLDPFTDGGKAIEGGWKFAVPLTGTPPRTDPTGV